MSMQSSPDLADLCAFPNVFRQGDVSPIDLVQKLQIGQTLRAYARSDIAEYLRDHANYVQDWLNWSSDKRTASGWYFRERGSGYEVGFFQNGPITEYADRFDACADFIVRELSGICRL